ncbi:MAG: hypothetical protein KatS3mg122_1676 [Caldimonas sp.]|uniref:lipase secretion chaperone n=1 Tax=Caldimonas taiwanensis TaxID=307483 RepID=UPI000785BFED|nr:lipase secretion chaperone [Caldimonas taiwanensis]GIX24445.1 MAG: hypothetical protein KatS3mg122_1676 [Caldimonas sp.]
MRISRRTLGWLLAAALWATAAIVLAPWQAAPSQPAGPSPHAAAAGGPAAERSAADLPGMREPIDLMGLTVDAARLFEIGYAGGLLIDAHTRDALEILLAQWSDEPSAEDLERLEWTLRDGLPAADAQQALALVQGYRAYLKDMRAEYQRLGIPASWQDAQTFFAQMEAVQRRHFGDEVAEALFGQDLRHGRLLMEAAFVARDPSLDPQARQARLAALRAQLPEALREAIAQETLAPDPGS